MRDRQGKIKLGLKYCGGCRAGYDRVGVVDSIKERFAQDVEFVAPESEDAQMILVVTGCPAACARLDNAGEIPIHYITSLKDARQWMEEMEIELKNIKRR